MDEVKITLPCGFETTYDTLQTAQKVIRCMKCDKEDLVVEDVLNRPANHLRLKAKKIELDVESSKKLKTEISVIKQDPKLNIEKNFEQIFNDLDMRRDDIRKNLDDYYTKLRSDLEAKKQSAIENYVKQEMEGIDFSVDQSIKDDSNVLKIKSNTIESKSEEISQKKDELNELINLSKLGERQKLIFPKVKINMEQIFGRIDQDDPKFDYKPKIEMKTDDDRICCIEKVDDTKILCGSESGIIRLWDINKVNYIWAFHEEEVTNLCILTNNLFANCSHNDIKIRRLNKHECVKILDGHEDSVTSLKLLSNGQLASCSLDKTIKIWNFKTGKCLRTINCQIKNLSLVEAGRNNTIISEGENYTIVIRNITSTKIVKTLKGHESIIRCLKLLDSNKLASGSCDKTIKIWNLKTSVCLRTLEEHSDCVNYLALPKSGHLVSSSEDGTMKFWNCESGECLKTIQENINGLLLTNNDDLITFSNNSLIKVWSKSV